MAEKKLIELLGSRGFKIHRGLTGRLVRVEGRFIYEQSSEHLWFCVARYRVVRIKKEQAEKILVLGLGG